MDLSGSALGVTTSVGAFGIFASGGKVTALTFSLPEEEHLLPEDETVLREAVRQLNEYLSGERKLFSIPLSFPQEGFSGRVLQLLREIPYGSCRSYGELAVAAGSPKAARAVGAACHHNPIPIFIPCHRVVGKNGRLTGYAGGLPLKEKLLRLEGVIK